MREDILDAAEAIVRDHGIEHLTVRSVAEATFYGKSTIHSHIGSKEELVDALADRVMDRHIRRLSNLAGGPNDSSDGRFATTTELIIEDPALATLMFGRARPRDLITWSQRWINTFSAELANNLEANDEAALGEALYLSHQRIVAVIPTIAASADRDFGVAMLRETFAPFSAVARELEEQRTNLADAG